MYEPTVEQSTMHLIVDQLEELLVTIIDEIRQRPSVALALLAAVTGALVGSMLAARASRRRAAWARRRNWLASGSGCCRTRSYGAICARLSKGSSRSVFRCSHKI